MKGRTFAADMMWPLLSGAFGLALWEGLVKAFEVPVFLLPAPTDIAETIVAKWSYLLSQLAITVMAAGLGLIISVVLGLVAGAAIAGSRFIDRILTPWLVVAHAIARVMDLAPKRPSNHLMVVNLSGRGDKDVPQVGDILKGRKT